VPVDEALQLGADAFGVLGFGVDAQGRQTSFARRRPRSGVNTAGIRWQGSLMTADSDSVIYPSRILVNGWRVFAAGTWIAARID
jgi:hypothetical protein